MLSEHAILSLSGAHIWLECAPSPRFAQQIPEVESVFAKEGTLAHDFASMLLTYFIGGYAGREDEFLNSYNAKYLEVHAWYITNGEWVATSYPGQDAKGLTDAMVEHAHGYALFVFNIGGTILVEERLDLARFIPLSYGRGDGLNLFPDVIYINDFKYGAGKLVSAKDNPQLMGYGLGAFLRAVELGYNPHTVVMNIIQPRMGSEAVSSAQISVTDLLEWAANTVAPQAALAIAGQGEFKAGPHCQFCKANTVCSAYYAKFAEAWGLQDPRVMSDEQRAFVLTYGDTLVKFVNNIKQDAVKRLRMREAVPGFKLVGTKGDRRFTDEVAVATKLWELGYTAEDIYTPAALKGITALESLFKPKRLFTEAVGDYITRPDGNPKLVPESDDTPGVGADIANLYDAPDLT